jgi:hypothetical protein
MRTSFTSDFLCNGHIWFGYGFEFRDWKRLEFPRADNNLLRKGCIKVNIYYPQRIETTLVIIRNKIEFTYIRRQLRY